MRHRTALALWQGALALGMPLVWRYFRRRAEGDPAYGAHLDERRGQGDPFEADIWVHAVSMGEMRSAKPLVTAMLERGWRIVTTHATPAGRREAEDAFADAIAAGRLAVRYAPVDRIAWWQAFLKGTRPKAGLAFEMEFWPGMIEAAAREGIPLILANSQVPSKSLSRARRLAAVAGHPTARAAAVWAKSDRMAERFRALGATDVEALGETRFDIAPPAHHIAAGQALREALGDRPVVTLASVVAGEEQTCLAALRQLKTRRPDLFAIWVPRAPELFVATGDMLKDAGLSVLTRSADMADDLAPPKGLAEADVLLGDSLGEMFLYLEPADAVVVGGGFVEKGAHNVIEPLSLGKPVITGPHVWTIEYPGVEAEAAGVLRIVEGDGLADAIEAAFEQDGSAARAFHAKHAGASARMLKRLIPLVET